MNGMIGKRIAIFGLPGSGKSTFSAKLGKILSVPVFHLDRCYFEPGWKPKDRGRFLAVQQELASQNAWIIEGNSIATLEQRFTRADTVIYFRFPRFFCLWRLFKRVFSYDYGLEDTPEGCSKKSISLELLRYLWNFEREKKRFY